jgi:hypothetical protein
MPVMSETYDKLKALLDSQKTLSKEDIDKAVAEHGAMTDDEVMTLEADRLEMEKQTKSDSDTVTLEQYLEAINKLDDLEEGSEEYKKAEAIVQKYESGG